MTRKYIILGGGIVGLTLAYIIVLKNKYAKVTIIDKEKQLGLHASGRNSGVIHSGVYYKSNTLKSKISVTSKVLFKEFLLENNIKFNDFGKLIVPSTDDDEIYLDVLWQRSIDLGLNSTMVDKSNVNKYEPFANNDRDSLFIKDTLVCKPFDVILALKNILHSYLNVEFIYSSEFDFIDHNKNHLIINKKIFEFDYLVNATGSFADLIARRLGYEHNYEFVPFKGLYWEIDADANFYVNGNIYPVPNPDFPFLGVHFTTDPYGKTYIGPTSIPAFGRENYNFSPNLFSSEFWKISNNIRRLYQKNSFNFRSLAHAEFRKYFKYYFFKDANKLVHNFDRSRVNKSMKIGIRPQLINSENYELVQDFLIKVQNENIVHILNAISPAFTCSFGLSSYIYDKFLK